MNTRNFVKEKLQAGLPVVGTWSIVNSVSIADLSSSSGLDFILFDLEHGVFDLPTLKSCVIAAEANGCSPIVRIPREGDPVIQNILDMGVHGIVTPQISDYEGALRAVRATKYSPDGTRGYNPFTRAGVYKGGVGDASPKLSNAFGLASLLVETEGAYRDLDKILQIKDLDVVYLGAYDMSLVFGCKGDLNHPKIVEFLKTSIQKISKAGKAAGVMFKTKDELKTFTDLGAKFLVYGVDTWVFQQAMRQPAEMLKSLKN